jgi:hypothetical protein
LEKDMSKLSINLRLVENNSKIGRDILNALLPDVKRYFSTKTNGLKDQIADILITNIMSEPEYSSLVSGSLFHEFGIPDPAGRIQEIFSAIKSGGVLSIKQPSISGNMIKGGFKVSMVKEDFADLISLGGSSLTTEKGSVLNWLKWLLIEGDTIIISDYSYSVEAPGRSRTGLGVMVSGGSWRVPPEFAGNTKNNWITRAIDKAMPAIESSITRAMKG